jgi:hypothetical protein
MGTVPTPYDAVALHKLSAAELDAGIKACLDWLQDGYPRVHAWDGAGVTLVNGTSTLLTLNSETYDTDNMHDTATFNSRIVCNTAGLFEFDWLISVPAVAYTNLDLNIRLNAAGSSAGGSSLRTQPYSDGTRGVTTIAFRFCRFMNSGDYVEAFVNQSSGANRVTSATSLGTRCQARWLATS